MEQSEQDFRQIDRDRDLPPDELYDHPNDEPYDHEEDDDA